MFRCSLYSIFLYYQGIQVVHLGQDYQGSREHLEDQMVQAIRGYPGHQASLEYPVQGNQGHLFHHSNQEDLYRQCNILTNPDSDTNSSLYIIKKTSHSLHKRCPHLKSQYAYQECPEVQEVPLVLVDQANQNQVVLEGQMHPEDQEDQNHL